MPEKKAKGFGMVAKDEAFQLKKKTKTIKSETRKGKQLILNITEAAPEKIRLRQVAAVHYTGNPLIDAYQRVNEFMIDHTKIKVKEKAVFFRLLAVMLNAGMPLIKSLRTLGVQSEKTPLLGKILFKMAAEIEGGKSLSESMEAFPDVFGDAQVGMVKAGEASGALNKTLKAIAEELEKTAAITGKVKGAMIYPIVIFILLGVAMFLMMILVVPQLTDLFSKTGAELPLPTKILIAGSDIAINYWMYMVLGIVIFIPAFGYWKKTRGGRYILDLIKLNIPIFGALFRKTALSKFARGFANLMGSGVQITKSIEIVAHSIGNEVYKRRLILTVEDMKRGIPMAENMSESKLFPTMLVNMIEIGEQTAQLENVMLKISEFYDEEVDTMVSSLTKIMEPMILIIIGVSVGGLVAAIMLPIMQLSDLASSA